MTTAVWRIMTPMVQEPSTPSALRSLMHGAAKVCFEPKAVAIFDIKRRTNASIFTFRTLYSGYRRAEFQLPWSAK